MISVKREILRRRFGRFVAWAWPLITGQPYVANAITTAIVDTLQAVADGKLTRVLIACPPGVGKSTLLAAFAAWRLARDPGWRSIHAGHAATLAENESRRVRRLVEGDAFRAMFPAVALRSDENASAMWSTTADGRYIAIGQDGAITGRRAHEAVCDDILNATDRHSKAAREACWTFFTEGLGSRLDGDNAPQIVCMQRLDRDDLIGRLIAAGGWHLVELAAEEPDGTLNAPNVLTRAKLDMLKGSAAGGLGAATFSCQYLQRPTDDSTATIKRTWWRFHRPAHVDVATPRPLGCDTDAPAVTTPDRFDRLVIAVDMTFGGLKTANDYAVAQVWGSLGAARYLLAQWRKRATQLEQRAAIKALAAEHPTARIVIEKAAGGAGALEILAADGIIAFPVTAVGGKDERLGAVSPIIESGHALLPLGAPWLAEFVEELAGATRHDDAKDTCAYALAELTRRAMTPVTLGRGAMIIDPDAGHPDDSLLRNSSQLSWSSQPD